MTLAAELNDYKQGFLAKVPAEALETMSADMERLTREGVVNNALKVGDTAPSFSLPNARGEIVTLTDVLSKGPVVLTFYRGSWCPYCNIALRHLQQVLPEIQAAGAQLIAISPQVPDESLSTAEKHDLQFEVLSDVGNVAAKQLGLVFQLGEAVRPLYKNFGIDVPAHNGDESYELPVPAAYVIDRTGVITYAFLELDYTKRAEPIDIIEHLHTLSAVSAS